MNRSETGRGSLRGQPRLLGDIGGTNIRLGLQSFPGGPVEHIRVSACANYSGVEAAIRHYLGEIGLPPLLEAALGIANPITGDWIRMTNHHWEFSVAELRESLGLARLEVINDFTALVLALPDIRPTELRQIGGSSPVVGAPVALIGAGTGLGVSGLLYGACDNEVLPISGEGGHVTLAAENELEWSVVKWFSQRYGHASAERMLSGTGLVDLHHALHELRYPASKTVHSAAEVTTSALKRSDPLSLATLEMFCSFLGSVAGNLALTLGARGGVYIGGGIVPRFGTWFDKSSFHSRFTSKGRFGPYLAEIPCWVIDTAVPPALLGLSRVLDRKHDERP